MRFAMMFADDLNHSSIKACLLALRSLNINRGLPDPLVNGLVLQHFLWDIKWVQSPVCPSHLPITTKHLRVIQHSLDLSPRDHVMLWAASCLRSSP